MGCEDTSEISPEIGEVNGGKTHVDAADGATYKVTTHGQHKEFGSAEYNEIDNDVGHNRAHMQSWWNEGMRLDMCGSDTTNTTAYALSVMYRIETDSNKWATAIEPDQSDLDSGSSYSFSAFVSFGGFLTAGVQAGVSTPGSAASTVDHDNYSHVEWNIDLKGESWPTCQDPSPGVKFDVNSDLVPGSSVDLPCKSQFEYRWNCGTGWFYETTSQISYYSTFYMID